MIQYPNIWKYQYSLLGLVEAGILGPVVWILPLGETGFDSLGGVGIRRTMESWELKPFHLYKQNIDFWGVTVIIKQRLIKQG